MDPNTQLDSLENDVECFFSDIDRLASEQHWTRDRQWTDGIHNHLSAIGHKYECLVYASQTRCPSADGPEWLYDHHWRIMGADGSLIRIPLAMEIEWGFGAKTIVQKIIEDFLKLVQARANLRVMVFQCNDVTSMTDRLISMVRLFNDSQHGDRWIFAGWDWDTKQICCKKWIV